MNFIDKQAVRLTDEELREYSDAYEMFVTDEKPYVTTSRLKELVKSLGFNPTDEEINELYLKVEYDRDGKCNFEEFVDLVRVLNTPEAEQESYLESFRAFDSKGRGYISSEEIREVLMHVMERSTPQEKDSILKTFRLDKDRKVSLSEFKRMISSRELTLCQLQSK